MVEVFVSELKKLIKLYPYQEDMIRKTLSNNNKDKKLYLLMGRYYGRTYLKKVYNQIFA